MAVRKESVRIELQDGFTTESAKVVAAMAAIRQAADRLDGTDIDLDRDLDRLSVSATKADRHVASFTRTVDSGARSIDQYSGRLQLIAQLVATLGPGLAPIGAVGIPAVTGLASAAGAASLAVGGLVAAAQGVGDAVGAIDEYQLEPTAENAEKARQAVEAIAPAAREFVAEFQAFQPTLVAIRDAAAEGWFPGLTDSLDNLTELGPQVEDIMREIGRAGGDGLEQATESLTTERWRPFLDFLAAEMPSALTSLLQITGDLAHGATRMWMSFDPGNDAFLGWLGDVADGFDRWASSSEGRDDIEGLLAYVREVGPGVQDFFTSLVGALTDVVQAAAPLGGPVLAALTGVLDVVSAVADSDLGTPVLAGVAALSVYNRTLAATAALQQSTFGRAAAGNLAAGGAVGGFLGRQIGEARASLPAMREVGTVMYRAGQSAAYASKETLKARQSVSSFARSAGRLAGPVGAIALASTGLGDNFKLSNTAMLGMAGTIGGPWGVAIGAGIGAMLDAKRAGADLESAMDDLDQSFSSGSVIEMTSALSAARSELDAFKESVDPDTLGAELKSWLNPGTYKNSFEGIFGTSDVDERRAELEKYAAQVDNIQTAFVGVASALGNNNAGLADVDDVARRAAPFMAELGVSMRDVAAMDPTQLSAFSGELSRMIRGSESAEGRMMSVGEALKGLADYSLTAEERVESLASSLDALLNPALNAEQATDAWRASIRSLREELDAAAGFKGFDEASMANRQASRDYVQTVQDRIVALAENGASEEKVATAVRASRQEFIQAGMAAGFSAEQMRRRADAIGLTPKLVRTTFEALGINLIDVQVAELERKYNRIPKRVQSEIRANGLPKTKADIDELVEKYKLTEKERRALVTLVDAASGKATAVDRLLDILNGRRPRPVADLNWNPVRSAVGAAISVLNNLDGKRPTPTADANWNPLRDAVAAASGALSSLDGRTATATILTRRITEVSTRFLSSVNPFDNAYGNVYPPVRSYALGDVANRHQPQIAPAGAWRVWAEEETGGEAYIPLANDHRRGRAEGILEDVADRFGMRLERYATGGSRGGAPSRSRSNLPQLRGELRELQRDFRGLGLSLRASQREVDREVRQRKAALKARKETASSTRDALRHDPFGNGLEGLRVQLEADRNDAWAARRGLRSATNKGASAALLQGLARAGDVNTITQLSRLSRAQINQYDKLYEQQQYATRFVGKYAGDQVARAATMELRASRRERAQDARGRKRLEKAIGSLRKEVRRGTAEGTRQGMTDRSRRTGQRARTRR